MNVLKLNSRNRRAGKKAPPSPAVPLKLNLGSGPSKMPGFVSVDCIAFPTVDVVTDLKKAWPWKDGSVEEIHCSHCIEHFTAMERVHVVNEMWRVMKPGAKATVICPDWSSCRAYGDPTHQWPPVSQFWFYYLKKEWRMSQAPHTDAYPMGMDPHNNGGKTGVMNINGFTCNFEVTWGFSLEAGVASRNQEYQQHAATYFKEACQDVIATFVAVK